MSVRSDLKSINENLTVKSKLDSVNLIINNEETLIPIGIWLGIFGKTMSKEIKKNSYKYTSLLEDVKLLFSYFLAKMGYSGDIKIMEYFEDEKIFTCFIDGMPNIYQLDLSDKGAISIGELGTENATIFYYNESYSETIRLPENLTEIAYEFKKNDGNKYYESITDDHCLFKLTNNGRHLIIGMTGPKQNILSLKEALLSFVFSGNEVIEDLYKALGFNEFEPYSHLSVEIKNGGSVLSSITIINNELTKFVVTENDSHIELCGEHTIALNNVYLKQGNNYMAISRVDDEVACNGLQRLLDTIEDAKTRRDRFINEMIINQIK